jgi:hypothetical protein
MGERRRIKIWQALNRYTPKKLLLTLEMIGLAKEKEAA